MNQSPTRGCRREALRRYQETTSRAGAVFAARLSWSSWITTKSLPAAAACGGLVSAGHVPGTRSAGARPTSTCIRPNDHRRAAARQARYLRQLIAAMPRTPASPPTSCLPQQSTRPSVDLSQSCARATSVPMLTPAPRTSPPPSLCRSIARRQPIARCVRLQIRAFTARPALERSRAPVAIAPFFAAHGAAIAPPPSLVLAHPARSPSHSPRPPLFSPPPPASFLL